MRAQGGAALAVAQARQPQFVALVQPVSKPMVAATTLLEAGDFLPMFEVHDTDKRLRLMENHAGAYCLLVYLPLLRPELAAQVYHEILAQLTKVGLGDARITVLCDDSLERVNKFREMFKVQPALCMDSDRRIARSLGLMKQGGHVPFGGFVIDRNLKITHVHVQEEPTSLAGLLVHDYAMELLRSNEVQGQVKTVRSMAPALVVSQVFTPEFCAKCIRAFQTGETFDGTVGAKEKKEYRADVKVRTDFIVRGDLLDEIDDKFSRSFFPEIKKVFGFEVTHREIYKIGLYKGEKGGFFKAHRDNFDYPMGYRRVASTIHLNDDYEGGGVRFPEYGDDVYRPTTGSAIAFSASTKHEALPVTKGERFILVAFVHGDEDEAYRRYYLGSRNEPLKTQDYQPKLRHYPELRQSRWFYDDWRTKNARFDGSMIHGQAATPLPAAANVNSVEAKPRVAAPFLITPNGHKPTKVFESRAGVVFDNFLPEDVYQRLRNWALIADYEYINTHGAMKRAWHVQDGFPLRTSQNFFYHAQIPSPKTDYMYPMKNDVDAFMQAILAIQPQVEPWVGKQSEQWAHFSVTGWMYPHGTGLSMHDDGSGVYTGAYTFFMNPTWRAHWGGMLLLMDDEANRMVHEYRNKGDQMAFYKKKFLHANATDELLLENGLAQCVFPKGNRIVFIANDGYHMITRVNEQCGDNLRMSLAGFFNRKK